jgi:hypothetical protein
MFFVCLDSIFAAIFVHHIVFSVYFCRFEVTNSFRHKDGNDNHNHSKLLTPAPISKWHFAIPKSI